ncbi:family 20 glycosylhydrolase [Microbacterium sp. NPDC096154]|uniref:family 20 glycosylhydrolase n=1 Tax=Microbacterium sp. NPDC096154 TaxID=3155549 RepID=UPI00332748E3
MPLALTPWPSSVAPSDGPPLQVTDASGTRQQIAAHLAEGSWIRADGHGPEGYTLDVTAEGVRIEASAAAGAFYARQTLAQLIRVEDRSAHVPAVAIRDSPRFAHRGLMLDVARHFHPVDTVEAVIDRAASLKLNALHLHLTDDHGWRLQLRSHPELAAAASATSVGGDPGGFYTPDDYARIVSYAAARHITVIPEIDLPGHTHALALSHPELASEPTITDAVREVAELYGGGLPQAGAPYTGLAVGFSSLRADAPGLEPLLRDVFGELAQLTPGPFVHFGGDEALGTPHEDYRRMVSLAAKLIAETGKTPVAWHEAGAAELPSGAVGQYWGYRVPRDGHDDSARAFVAAGGSIILSPADAVYLDMKYDVDTPLGLTWADGPTSVARSYDWEPAHVLADVAESAILGIEACLWTETIRDLADIDAMMFPRVASAAELAWSSPASPERTWHSFRERIAGLADGWTESGIAFHRSAEIPWRAGPAAENAADSRDVGAAGPMLSAS